MARIATPILQAVKSERFRVAPLWSWSLAAASLVSGASKYCGVGFDKNRMTARNKAVSEAMERLVISTWRSSGVSPFTGDRDAVPPNTSGFAAHLDRPQAEERAFFEWRERVVLNAVNSGQVSLLPADPLHMGLLFNAGLQYVDCQLRAFLTRETPYVSFVFGTISSKGVIFGSACRRDKNAAIEAATGECLRKLAFISEWTSTTAFGPLPEAIKYWMSWEGISAVDSFLKNASIAGVANGIPTEADSAYSRSMQLSDLWVAHYWDPRYALPEAFGGEIPLV